MSDSSPRGAAVPAQRRNRAQAREEMQAGILRAGRSQLAQRGAAALSLREVARELGVVSSAVYRYVASRDELLTLLLVDAYEDLANHVDVRLGASRATGAGRLRVLGTALLEWGTAHPEQWVLIYGTPVPGYVAPSGSTTDPGTRVMTRLLEIAAGGRPSDVAQGADRSGRRTALPRKPGRAYAAYLRAGVEELGVDLDVSRAATALEGWTALVGAVSAEVFGHLGPDAAGLGEEIMARVVAQLAQRLGLD